MNKFFALFAAIALLILTGSSTATADHGDLSGDQIRQTISGAKGKGRTGQGANFEVQYGTDGSLKLTLDSSFSDTGKCEVEENRYCAQWSKIRNGRKQCWTVRHLNSEKFLFKGLDGANNTTAEISR